MPSTRRWDAAACAAEYERRTGRSSADDVRLGWALAVREYVRTYAARSLVALDRSRRGARKLDQGEAPPGWVRRGMQGLQPAFAAYAPLDGAWALLAAAPPWLLDLHRVAHDEAAVRALVGGLGATEPLDHAVAQAAGELPAEVHARRQEGALRELSYGIRARFELAPDDPLAVEPRAASGAEVNLLCGAVEIERFDAIERARRTWGMRLRRWALPEERRGELTLLALRDRLLDGPSVPRAGPTGEEAPRARRS
jgi:hypothetical protein